MPALPPEIRVLSQTDQTRLTLPVRIQTGAKWVGCAPIAFGMIFSGFAIFWMCGASGIFDKPPMGPEGPLPHPPFDWTRLIFALFGVPFFLAGLLPMAMGLMLLLPSRAEIIITDKWLLSRNRFGLFSITQRRLLTDVATLRIASDLPGVKTSNAPIHGIVAEGPDCKTLYLAQRDPPEMLTLLVNNLADEINRRSNDSFQNGPEIRKVKVLLPPAPEPAALPVEVAPQPPAPAVVTAQPPDSKIIFMGTPDALTFAIPRTGFKGVALFFLIFSLVWDSITFTVFAVFAVQFIGHPSLENCLPLAFLGLFIAIGFFMALAAIQTAFRRAVILATHDSLVYTQKGPIRNAEFQWTPKEIKSIRADLSGTTINNRALKELQIHTTAGKKHGFFDGRDDAELEWLASTLRAYYQL